MDNKKYQTTTSLSLFLCQAVCDCLAIPVCVSKERRKQAIFPGIPSPEKAINSAAARLHVTDCEPSSSIATACLHVEMNTCGQTDSCQGFQLSQAI